MTRALLAEQPEAVRGAMHALCLGMVEDAARHGLSLVVKDPQNNVLAVLLAEPHSDEAFASPPRCWNPYLGTASPCSRPLKTQGVNGCATNRATSLRQLQIRAHWPRACDTQRGPLRRRAPRLFRLLKESYDQLVAKRWQSLDTIVSTLHDAVKILNLKVCEG